MPHTATIDTSEWHAAYEAVRVVEPSEQSSLEGVAVVTTNGLRRWVAWDERLVMATTPTPAGVDGDVTAVVSPRLVTYADTLAHLDGEVAFTLDGDVASVSSTSGGVTLDRPDSGPIPTVAIGDGRQTVASVDPVRLRVFLSAAGELPRGLEPSGPTFWFTVGDGRIGAAVDWRPWGVPAARFEVAAATTGPATSIPVDHRVLKQLVEFADPDDDVVLAVPTGRGVLHVTTRRWVAEVRTVDLSSRAWYPDVDAFFNNTLFPHAVTQDDEGGWDIDAGGTTVHAVLEDGPCQHVLRLTVTAARGVAGTADVLREINALTAGLVNVRVWWDNGDVIAGTDIPCPAVGDLGAGAVDNLVAQVAGLGPFVAALAGLS